MKQKHQKTLMAAAMALAMGGSGSAFGVESIMFDPDGTGGTFGAKAVASFAWSRLNILANDCIPAPKDCALLVQAKLANFIDANNDPVDYGGNPFAGREFTLVMKINVNSDLAGGTLNFFAGTLADSTFTAGNYFRIYSDTTPDSNTLAGTGFDDGTLLLNGLPSASSISFTQTVGAPATQSLDRSGVDNYPLVDTIRGGGDFSANIDVIVPPASNVNTDYFKDPFSQFAMTVNPDATHDQPDTLPFLLQDPAGQFMDGTTAVTPDFGDSSPSGGRNFHNDFDCDGRSAVTGAACDFQMDASGTTSWNHTLLPEPGSLALLSLGLGIVGFRARRKRLA